MKKDILIIGGMGPQASLLLHEKIVKQAIQEGAKDNEDFPIITHLSLPVPDFISNELQRPKALRFINQRLERLWRPELHTRNYCVQHSASTCQ